MKPTSSITGIILIALLSGRAQAQTSPEAPPNAASERAAAVAPLAESLSGEALEAYEAAKLLYADGDYAGAVLKFQRAYDLSKDPRLLWNLAGTEKYLRHYARVEALLVHYLAAESAVVTEEDRADARAILDTVRAFIADVTINVDQPGAEVAIDDAQAGTSPLPAPLRLDMGLRKIGVRKTGFQEFTTTRSLAGGTKLSVDVTLLAEIHEGRLRISATSGDTIRVNGKVVGTGQWEGRLPSGSQHIEVSAPGKQPWRSDSVVQDGQLTTVLVTLSANPAVAPAGVPTWLWVAGGAVVAAGLGTGAYFLFKPEEKGPPPALEGSFGTVELPLRRR